MPQRRTQQQPSTPKNRRSKPISQPIPDRLPPHSTEDEQAVLGCVLIDPGLYPTVVTKFGGNEVFYDLQNQLIWHTMVDLSSRKKHIEEISIIRWLKDHKKLGDVDDQYVLGLQDRVPSAANLPNYLDIVWEKFQLRQTIAACAEVTQRCYESTSDFDELMWANRSDLSRIAQTREDSIGHVWSIKDLMDFDHEQDTNALVGLRDGRQTRYLCRGYGAWLIGPSGIGKSSFIHQMAFSWAIGQNMCGIAPVKPWRILIVQAENDKGDAAEMTQGILSSLSITHGEMDDGRFDLINDNVKVLTERRTVGDKFCSWLAREIERHRADIVFADPFLSFAGLDVARQDQVTKFLRQSMNPVLHDTGAALFAAHHTGKPKRQQDMKGWTAIDYAYSGIGSSELVNWARAVMVLVPLGDNVHYELKLAKRGYRAGARHPSGEFTTSIYLRHAMDRIFWDQVEAPEQGEDEQQQPRRERGQVSGRPSKVDELLKLGVGSVIDRLTEPTGRNALIKRLEEYAASRDLDISSSACRDAIAKLVSNKALRKTSEGYVKP